MILSNALRLEFLRQAQAKDDFYVQGGPKADLSYYCLQWPWHARHKTAIICARTGKIERCQLVRGQKDEISEKDMKVIDRRIRYLAENR